MTSKKPSFETIAFGLVGLILLLGSSGCVTAAAAAVGTVAGIEYTNRGAKGDLKGPIDRVAQNTQKTFEQMGIMTTETKIENGGTKRFFGGKKGDLNVSATLTSAGKDVTHVEVEAKTSPIQWNKDYAREVIQRIAAQ